MRRRRVRRNIPYLIDLPIIVCRLNREKLKRQGQGEDPGDSLPQSMPRPGSGAFQIEIEPDHESDHELNMMT